MSSTSSSQAFKQKEVSINTKSHLDKRKYKKKMKSLLEKAENNRKLGKNMNFTYHFHPATKKIKVQVFLLFKNLACLRPLHFRHLNKIKLASTQKSLRSKKI